MPYSKQKDENYTNFGGLNLKLSQYLTQKTEFLKLDNFDSQTLGALGRAPGIVPIPFGFGGMTNVVTGIQSFGYTSGSAIVITSTREAYNMPSVSPMQNIYSYVYPGATNQFSFAKTSGIYATNAYDFFYYSGYTAWQYGLPKIKAYSALTSSGTGSGLSGALTLAYAYIRQDGLIGPANFASFSLSGQTILSFTIPQPTTTVGVGISTGSFGISGIQSWYSLNGSAFYQNLFLESIGGITLTTSGTTTTAVGYTITPIQPEDYFGTFLYGFNTNNGASAGLVNADFNPSTIAQFNNQLFASGFAERPDEVWFSEVGEPEKHDLEAFFEFRANDGDKVSCLMPFFTQLLIFKKYSFGILNGNDPDNFSLAEASTIYGCLGPNAACVWENHCWFISASGVCEFNGANPKIVSDNVQPYFERINVNSENHFIEHWPARKEVWCAIAIDGSDYANILLVFDYDSGGWYVKPLPNSGTASYLENITNNPNFDLQGEVNYFGSIEAGPTYAVKLFSRTGDIFTGDGVTCVAQSRFLNPLGNSVQKVFRRLYLDAVIPPGQTMTIPVNFYKDQGTTYALQTTMVISDFQKRIDFGISAKDLSVEFIYSGASYLQINGFTIDYRWQRND